MLFIRLQFLIEIIEKNLGELNSFKFKRIVGKPSIQPDQFKKIIKCYKREGYSMDITLYFKFKGC